MGSAPTHLSALGADLPVLAAPMAGGPSTVDLVVAAGRAGSLGLLAAGYKTAAQVAEQIAAVRAAGVAFGVNLFAPNPVPVDPAAFHRYAAAIQSDADPYGIDLSGAVPVEDDDGWAAKLDLLLSDPVPLAGFTFGIPTPATIALLHAAGTIVLQTVTSADEARHAADAGADVLAVQASAAGGHSGTLTPHRLPPATPIADLVGQVAAAVPLPLVAAGGLGTADDVAAVLAAGAQAAMVGTVLLRALESGASATHRAALADPSRGETVVTRAFTGRPARALRNDFTDRHGASAPSGYPALHHLTSALRRAAAAAGDADRVHLWAGTGYRHAREEPAADVLTRLAGRA
ncbi:MAG: nitronate monooxygenase [Jatrophihabitantaceae bacterium]